MWLRNEDTQVKVRVETRLEADQIRLDAQREGIAPRHGWYLWNQGCGGWFPGVDSELG